MNEVIALKKMRNGLLISIKGWLLLVFIGLIYSLVRTVFLLNDLTSGFYQQALIQRTVNSYITGAQRSTLGVWTLYEVIFNSLVIAFIICALILMFSKSRFFPKFMIFYLVIDTLLQGLDYILGYGAAPGNYPSSYGVINALITSVIWIPYFMVSKQVKETFINQEIVVEMIEEDEEKEGNEKFLKEIERTRKRVVELHKANRELEEENKKLREGYEELLEENEELKG
ncbi:DUF2569 domain-containing protein [Neobacillus pocheonensis]|uniref:DUF2569 domain-containing protein n=1 Tax=Neobacillus pocheonensis TaxID=363869 RepID=A0ABT0W737_9BACI|nr:DUF2569 domain-containing protein [Neobacillus pocheonensis]